MSIACNNREKNSTDKWIVRISPNFKNKEKIATDARKILIHASMVKPCCVLMQQQLKPLPQISQIEKNNLC